MLGGPRRPSPRPTTHTLTHTTHTPPLTPHTTRNNHTTQNLGYLVSVDSYMNLQLANTEEYIDGAASGALGEVLIRCNNVLYMRGAPEDDEEGGGGGGGAA